MSLNAQLASKESKDNRQVYLKSLKTVKITMNSSLVKSKPNM